MSFFNQPTLDGLSLLIEGIRVDYDNTVRVLNNQPNHGIVKLFKSKLWVEFPSKTTKKGRYKVYKHIFTGCNVRVYTRHGKSEVAQIRRKLLAHVEKYNNININGINQEAIELLSRRGVSGKPILNELDSRISRVYNNAIKIIRFLTSIGYRHGGEGNQSNAKIKKGFKPADILSLLPAEAWVEESPASGHFSRKSTILPNIRIGGSNHDPEVSEGQLIDFARLIQDYVNSLSRDIFKLPFGYIETIDELQGKLGKTTFFETMKTWYQNLPLFAILQYVARNDGA
jgi:hypothetical protein